MFEKYILFERIVFFSKYYPEKNRDYYTIQIDFARNRKALTVHAIMQKQFPIVNDCESNLQATFTKIGYRRYRKE